MPRYARTGIPEVGIEDLQNDTLLVYRQPEGQRYHTTLTLSHADSISAGAFPEISFGIADLSATLGLNRRGAKKRHHKFTRKHLQSSRLLDLPH